MARSNAAETPSSQLAVYGEQLMTLGIHFGSVLLGAYRETGVIRE